MNRRRQLWISLFVVAWNLLFLYETFRHFQLTPLLRALALNWDLPLGGRELPKLPMLFPPAGWIMFYHVGDGAGGIEVYGIRGGTPALLDPHAIFETRYILFDNIRRGMMFSSAEPGRSWDFCNYLRRKFPEYPDFAVTQYQVPSLVKATQRKTQAVLYRCYPS